MAQHERVEGLGEPGGECLAPARGQRVDLAVGLPVPGPPLDLDRALLLERVQFAVDLALRGRPERPHRPLEPLPQRVPGGRLEREEPEDRVSE